MTAQLTLYFTLPPRGAGEALSRLSPWEPCHLIYLVAFDQAEGADVVKLEGQKPGCSLLVRKPPQNNELKQSAGGARRDPAADPRGCGSRIRRQHPRRLSLAPGIFIPTELSPFRSEEIAADDDGGDAAQG